MTIETLEFIVATSADFESLVARYRIHLKAKGRSQETQAKYSYHLNLLLTWLAGRGCQAMAGLSRSLLEEWIAEMHDKWSPATVKQAVAAMRSFVTWLEEAGEIKERRRNEIHWAVHFDR